jgi:hypothetical protein
MSEATATETTATDTTSTTATVETNVDTQSSTQEDTTTATTTTASKPSKEAGITATPAEAPASEETQESAEQAPNKPSYEGMIQGYIDGDLTDEDYSLIEKSGLSREQFDLMAEGYKARQEKATQDLYSWVGGESEYKSLQEFGASYLSEQDIEIYNDAINSPNQNIAKMAVLGLRAMYQEQKGAPPSMRIESDGSSSQAVEAFTSQQEVIRALNDRRYGRDQEYTNTVNARRAKSVY